MRHTLSISFASACSLLLVLGAPTGRACQQGGGTSVITAIPTLGGSVFQVNALNPAGQITGFSYTPGDLAAHAYLYGTGPIVDLGTLGGNVSQGFDINASGQVVGESDVSENVTHAFLFNGSSMIDLGTLGGSFSSAAAVNNAGQIAGYSLISEDLAQQAFVYANGSMTNLGTLGGASSSAVAINQAGNVAGDSFTLDMEDHAFLYSNGAMLDLGTLGGNYSISMALNDANVVVGESAITNGDTHGFIFSGGAMLDVGTLGGTYSSARAVNCGGQTIGFSSTADDAETHGFIYSGGTLTDLGTLGGTYTDPAAINDLGQVVGDSGLSNDDPHAFLWQNGTMVDLNTLLPSNSGWELITAQFINDSSRIVGTGIHNGISEFFVMDLGTANNPPVAVAGPDQVVDCAAQAILDGSHSNDPDNDALTYEWSEGTSVLGATAILSISLPIGVHTVSLKVTDPCGASCQTNLMVEVRDTTAPSITCPAPVTVSSGADCQASVPDLRSQVVVSDNCTASGSVILSQSPVAGTTVALGDHSILFTATDSSGNSASCSTLFRVVDTTPPVIVSGPALGQVSVAANCQGAVPSVISQIVATDNCTPAASLVISQNPAAGALVGLGQQTIVVTVTDASGNSIQGSLTFVVVDTTAPSIISVAAPITLAVTANCQVGAPDVLASVVATDNCTAANQLTISQSPVAGASLGLGQHSITVTVTDASGNSSTANVLVTVVDTTAPSIISVPAPITLSVTANCQVGAPDVRASVVATDNCTAANQLTISQSPVAGASLGLGQHSITVTVTDASGNSSTATVLVTVVDSTAPSILSAPASVTVSCQGVVPNVLSSVVATDNCTAANQLVIAQSPAAGTVLPSGQHFITVTVTDASGNSTSRDIAVMVADATAPVISSVTASPNVLSPPNHQFVPVTISVSAADNCDSAPVSKIIGVSCNETSDPHDVQITGDLTLNLAATRNPAGGGRTYTITIRCTDASGNSSTATVTVTVPKGNGKP